MNTLNYLNTKYDKEFKFIRNFLFKNYIKTNVEPNNFNRIVFISDKYKTNFKNPITTECNGLVAYNDVDNNKFKMLVCPVELFNCQKLFKSEIIRNFNNDKYKIYKINDGTIINLYFFDGKWRISTSKSYDANNLIFVDNKTYLDIFNEIINEIYPNFSFDNLNINMCYSLCMKYKKFHRFGNFNKITFIQSVNMAILNSENKKVINENEDIGLTLTEIIEPKMLSYSNLTNNNINALAKFKKDKNFETAHLGYILRSKDNIGEYSNILIESSLMNKIRNLTYNHKFLKNLAFYNIYDSNNVCIIKNFYNIPYITGLHVFLSGKNLNTYTLLYPDQQSYFKLFDKCAKYIANKVLLSNQMHHELQFDSDNVDTFTKIILRDLSISRITVNEQDGYDIVLDFIKNNRYIDYYYNLLV